MSELASDKGRPKFDFGFIKIDFLFCNFLLLEKIPDRGHHGSGTNDIARGSKSWGTSQKVAGVEVSGFLRVGDQN